MTDETRPLRPAGELDARERAEFEMLREVLDHSPALIGAFDDDGTCRFMSLGAAGQFGPPGGSPAGQFGRSPGGGPVGQPPRPAEMPPEARAWIDAVRGAISRGPSARESVITIDSPTGPREYELDLQRATRKDGSTGWVITAWDVSERLEAERRVQRVERDYELLSRVNQAILRARDGEHALVDACAIATTMGGLALAWVGAEDPDTRDVSVVCHSGEAAAYLDGLHLTTRADVPQGRGIVGRAIREGRAVVSADVADDIAMAYRERLAQFGLRSAAAFPVRLADGRAGVLVLYSDATNAFEAVDVRLFTELADDLSYALRALETETMRAAAEERLRDSERRYRDLFEKNPQPMWVFDIETLRFLAVNEAAVRAYGYTRDEFLEMTIRDIRPAEDLPRLVADVAREQPGLRSIGEWRHLRKDGSPLVVEITAHDMKWEGREARLVLVTDVTERRALETRLAQAARLEAIGQLAGGIAHDFNNLLTAVNGYADLLLATAQDEESRNDLTEIRRAGGRAADLTRQILAFARRQVLEARPLDVNDVVNGIVPLITRLLGERVRIETSLSPGPTVVNADLGQLEQVVLNLAVNAGDAMPSGGTLRIETRVEDAGENGAEVPGRRVLLVVTDTGTGMDAQTLARAFDPFFTTKEPGRGTGLGLATVHGIVTQSGGTVWATSTPGVGTVFTVALPSSDAAPDIRLPQSVPARAATATATILVVEDEQLVRRLVVTTLERAGYRTIVAQSPSEARALADGLNERIDLLLTDLVLPGGSGRELADELVRSRPGLRAIVMSGYDPTAASSPGDPRERFLPKPFAPADLLDAVSLALAEPEGDR